MSESASSSSIRSVGGAKSTRGPATPNYSSSWLAALTQAFSAVWRGGAPASAPRLMPLWTYDRDRTGDVRLSFELGRFKNLPVVLRREVGADAHRLMVFAGSGDLVAQGLFDLRAGKASWKRPTAGLEAAQAARAMTCAARTRGWLDRFAAAYGSAFLGCRPVALQARTLGPSRTIDGDARYLTTHVCAFERVAVVVHGSSHGAHFNVWARDLEGQELASGFTGGTHAPRWQPSSRD